MLESLTYGVGSMKHHIPCTSPRSKIFGPAIYILIAFTGCADDEWHAETVPATGQVTVNGEFPVGAIIRLHPVNEAVDKRASRPSGIVGEDGTYTLTTYEFGDGAPAGEYTFTLYWPKDPRIGGLSPDRLLNLYATPKTSPLKIRVATDGAPLEPIAIENARVDSSSPSGRASHGPARSSR